MTESQNLADLHRDLLRTLLSRAGLPLNELPYTNNFEQLYTELIRESHLTIDRHDTWKALLDLKLDDVSEGERLLVSPPHPTVLITSTPQPASSPVPPVTNTSTRASTTAGFTSTERSLFDLQPWHLTPRSPLADERRIEREQLLAAIATSKLGKTEQRVAYILHRYPETRDSDTALAIRYWLFYQSDVLEKWDRLELTVLYDLDNMETISRIRRHIQNELRLFTPSDHMRQQRNEFQMEFNQYLAVQRSVGPEVRFYLDETGNEASKAYTGVAGICMMNWRQYEKHWSSLTQWRKAQGWPETIHFADTGITLQPRALSLLWELQKRQAGLLFVGYALPSRGNTARTMLSLFIQLVIDSLHHMNELQCLEGPKVLTVVKEAEPGFDSIYLRTMKQDLADQVGQEFPDQVVMGEIQPLTKGRDVFLECADLIAGGMQRRTLYGGRNPKDVLAEAVFNITGFEDPRDNGTVFKAHLP